jgi:protein dithiol:quinone oxidoreductase
MSTRLIYLLSFLIIIVLLSMSFYLEYYAGMVPCPLCSLQRLVFCLLGILFLAGILLQKKLIYRTIINSAIGISSILGLILAGRQIWLQHFPAANTSECAASLSYLVEIFPINEVLRKIIFEGGMECGKRGYEFLHINIAEWSFLWFLLSLLLTFYLFLREIRNHHDLRMRRYT